MNRYLEDRYEEKKESSIQDDILSTTSSKTVRYQETEHARLRRKQRCIDEKDLQAAIKYGTCEPHHWGKGNGKNKKGGTTDCIRYTYKDIVYIVNERTMKEVTCYARPVTLDPIPIPLEMQYRYEKATTRVQSNLNSWTSNTVMVIDTSGSMRTSDMWGTRNRLKSVWFSVALDFLAQRLESGNATVTDVISIIAMGDTPRILCEEVPTTWDLYNQIATVYSIPTHRDIYGLNPQGHGYFLPSLTLAEELLKRNTNASCAAALIFLSDGAPSDQGPLRKENIITKVESLAKSFGRRLTFTTIGIGDLDDFSMLQSMVDAAKDYGATAEFKLPSMTSSSLGIIFTSVATSLTTTQTEMTDLGTLKQRQVRDVERESRSKASQVLTQVNMEDFYLYKLDNVTRKVYTEEFDHTGTLRVSYQKVPLQHPDARFVALSKGPFGEGAERFAFRFFEVAGDGKTIVGRPLVAKESRMVLDIEEGQSEDDARKKFVKTFVKTQQIARRLAVKFNDKLKKHPRVHPDTPQISFLDCSIYELKDNLKGKSSVLVENKLDHNQWYKWNSNNGMVNGEKTKSSNDNNGPSLLYNIKSRIHEIVHNFETSESRRCARRIVSEEERMSIHGVYNKSSNNPSTLYLNIIEEGSDEDESNEEEEEDNDNKGNTKRSNQILFTPSQVAQAFSHFSYLLSDQKRLVCDLQGVFDENKNVLQFSDPVIHYYNPHSGTSEECRKCVHGRTDRGRDGIRDFLETHCCKDQGNLCQLLCRGFRNSHHNERRREKR